MCPIRSSLMLSLSLPASTVSKVGPGSFTTFRLLNLQNSNSTAGSQKILSLSTTQPMPEAATRLNDLFHSALNVEQIRDFIRDKLFNLPDTQRRINNFTLVDAQLVVARLYGFKDWDELVQSA